MLPGHNRIDHVRSTVQFGTLFSTRFSEVIRLLEEVGVQLTPALCMKNECKCFGRPFSRNIKPKRKATLGSKNYSHACVRIIDLHTPSDSLPHFALTILQFYHSYVILSSLLTWICMFMIIHCESKNGATLTMAITFSIIRCLFVKFFHSCKEH